MKYNYQDGILSISLEEELDVNSCKTLRTVIDGYIMKYQPDEFFLNLEHVKFMDSSGIGLILGRYNLLKLMNCNMTILNPTNSIKRVIELSDISNKIAMRSE